MKKMISSGAHFDQIKKPVSEPSLAEEPATTATMIASPTKPRIKRENAADSSEKEPTQKPAFAKGEKSRTGKRQVSDLYNDILMRGRTKKATSLLFDSLSCSSLFFSTSVLFSLLTTSILPFSPSLPFPLPFVSHRIIFPPAKTQEEKEILDNPYFKPPVSAKSKALLHCSF